MLSEEVYLSRFSKDRLAAMSQKQVEDALARAKQRVVEFEEYEKSYGAEMRRRVATRTSASLTGCVTGM